MHKFSSFGNKVTLLGGGVVTQQTFGEVLTLAPHLVAADGAAATALALGHMPERVIGDLDSLDPATRAALPPGIIQQISEQDSTDFDKALRSLQAPMVLGVGFMGGRLDHELAAYNSLVRHPDRKCILVGEDDICFHVANNLTLNLRPATRLSLFPMAPVVAHATGLKHPVEALEMSPWGRIGTSNEVISPRVKLRFDRPGMLVILPRAALRPAIAALEAQG